MTKKERELYYLRRAMALSADFPDSEPIATEAPDFLFKLANTLGIEVTDYIRRLANTAVTVRTVESLHERVAFDARSLFETHHAAALQVTMHWNPSHRLNKAGARELAKSLAHLIAGVLPLRPRSGTVIDQDTHGNLDLFHAIPRIHVRALPSGTASVWWPIEAGFIGGSFSEIQKILDTKETLIDVYRRQCVKLWLLIVADGRRISSSLELKDCVGLSTSFDRVYYLDDLASVVTRLA